MIRRTRIVFLTFCLITMITFVNIYLSFHTVHEDFFFKIRSMVALLLFKKPRLNIVVVFFGVIPRSIRYTWPSINKKIIDPLKNSRSKISIYVFNLVVGRETLVDGRILDQNDVNIIPYDILEQFSQHELNEEIQTKCSMNSNPCVWRWDYSPIQQINAMRQMYNEQRVGDFLQTKRGQKYDVAIVISPDFYFPSFAPSINVENVYQAARSKKVVFTTSQNDAEGYTNGFYIGKPTPLTKILNRYNDFDKFYRNIHRDYEKILKRSFEVYDIERRVTEMMFLKVRANGDVVWQVNFDQCQFCNVTEIKISMIQKQEQLSKRIKKKQK